jgi:hypothetical protein
MSQNSKNQGFSYYICLMIEGSGSRAESGSGSKTRGSGESGFGTLFRTEDDTTGSGSIFIESGSRFFVSGTRSKFLMTKNLNYLFGSKYLTYLFFKASIRNFQAKRKHFCT